MVKLASNLLKIKLVDKVLDYSHVVYCPISNSELDDIMDIIEEIKIKAEWVNEYIEEATFICDDIKKEIVLDIQ